MGIDKKIVSILPLKLKIGAHVFRVQEVPDGEFNEGICGRINKDTNVISVRSTLSDSQKWSTLFHEIFHSINSELNESIVDSLAEQIYQVLKDNKLLNERPQKTRRSFKRNKKRVGKRT
jgi:hypothetical protein